MVMQSTSSAAKGSKEQRRKEYAVFPQLPIFSLSQNDNIAINVIQNRIFPIKIGNYMSEKEPLGLFNDLIDCYISEEAECQGIMIPKERPFIPGAFIAGIKRLLLEGK